MTDKFESLDIEKRGGDQYALVHVNAEGGKSEIPLSGLAVALLARLAANHARQIQAEMAGSQTVFGAVVASHPQELKVNVDLHQSMVIVRAVDEFEAQFDFALTASQAKTAGEMLLQRATQV